MYATHCLCSSSYYQKECFNTVTGSVALHKVAILELLKYNAHHALCAQLNEWSIPIYPLNGQTLLANGCPPGKTMGAVQSQLRDLWKDSAFVMSRDELLERLPDVVKAVVDDRPSSPKKRKAAKN